jgi:uncharacterized protein
MGPNFMLSDVQKKRLFNALLAVVVFLAVFLAIKSLSELKESAYIGKGVYPANVISVSGEGEVLTVPDVASFSFSVVEEGKTVGDAQDKSSKKINAIIDAVKAMGVEEKDIKTISYNSYPKYEYSNSVCPASRDASVVVYCPPGKQVLTGYEVSQSILIKVRKTDEAGEVLTKVGGLGASNISGLDFVIDDLDAAQAEARDKAIQDAKAKAKVLAKSLGVRLVKIVSFSEGGNYPIMYGMGGIEAKTMSMDAVAMPTPPQLPTGENKTISNVTITYEVE